MQQIITLPQNLDLTIGSEQKDFAVKSKRERPLKKSIRLLLGGILVTAFTGIFVFILLVPIFQGKEVHFESNRTPVVAGPNNLRPIIFPGIIIMIFVITGISMIIGGIYSIYKKGGYFVGTPTRFVFCQGDTIRSIDWEQFTGDIEVSGNTQTGDISLKLRTGQMVREKNHFDRYVPDVILISGIQNVFDIEQICRKRIKENDPTPTSTMSSVV